MFWYKFYVLDGKLIKYEFLQLLKWKKIKEPKWHFRSLLLICPFFYALSSVPSSTEFLKKPLCYEVSTKPESTNAFFLIL